MYRKPLRLERHRTDKPTSGGPVLKPVPPASLRDPGGASFTPPIFGLHIRLPPLLWNEPRQLGFVDGYQSDPIL